MGRLGKPNLWQRHTVTSGPGGEPGAHRFGDVPQVQGRQVDVAQWAWGPAAMVVAASGRLAAGRRAVDRPPDEAAIQEVRAAPHGA